MGGHSHWSQVKRAKGVADNKRGALFTKLGREITVAGREGGSTDIDANFRLRLAVQRARDANMPNETIERAIKRGGGGGDANDLAEITYEGYGPSGVAIILEVVTDNRNRSVSEIRSAMTRGGGNLGEAGCVSWLFDSKGVIIVEAGDRDPDEIVLAAIDAGAEDVDVVDSSVEVHTRTEDLEQVRRALQEHDFKIESAELTKLAKTTISLGEKEALQTLKLLDRLEELEDVQRVHSNADFPDEVLAAFSG